MPIVQNSIRDPASVAYGEVAVTIRLVADDDGAEAGGFVTSEDVEIIGRWTVESDDTGAWSATLYGNDDIIPENSYYKVTENPVGAPPVINDIIVPTSGGPYTIGDILKDTPGALPPGSALTNHVNATSPHPNLVSGPTLSDDTPATVSSSPTAGVSDEASRSDHVHNGLLLLKTYRVADDTAPGKTLGLYSLTADELWHPYPGGATFDLPVECNVGEILRPSVDILFAAPAADTTMPGLAAITVAVIDDLGDPIRYMHATSDGTEPYFGWLDATYKANVPFAIFGLGDIVVTSNYIFDGVVTLRMYYIASDSGSLGGVTLIADETRPATLTVLRMAPNNA